jgi:serine protease AprX
MGRQWFLIVWCIFFSVCVHAQIGQDKRSLAVQNQQQKAEAVDVIIQVRGDAALALLSPRLNADVRLQHASQMLKLTALKSQQPLRKALQEQGISYRHFWVTNAIAARLSPAQIKKLAQRKDVLAIEYDGPIAATLPPTENIMAKTTTAIEWNISQVRAHDVWSLGYRGQGVVIAGADTGYQWDHPALIRQYRGWNGMTVDHAYNWHDAIHGDIAGPGAVAGNSCGFDSVLPCDDDSHGTHTMGTMVGDDASTNQIGVAPDARWMACRNMENGNGRPSTYIECFQWFLEPTNQQGLAPDPSKAPHIISNSWACPPSEECAFGSLQSTVDNVRAAGILVVVAAGNGAAACSTIVNPPAIYASGFTVGASTQTDAIASFSLWGPVTIDGSNRQKPDVVAPGAGVRSAVPGNAYGTKSGTSMATPNVAGIAALMMSANPELKGNPDLVEQILKDTAVRLTTTQNCMGVLGSQIPNAVFGYGRVDAYAAVQRALLLAPLFNDGFE